MSHSFLEQLLSRVVYLYPCIHSVIAPRVATLEIIRHLLSAKKEQGGRLSLVLFFLRRPLPGLHQAQHLPAHLLQMRGLLSIQFREMGGTG